MKMLVRTLVSYAVIICLCAGASSAVDYVVSGVTTNDPVWVGTTTADNTLSVTNSGALTNSVTSGLGQSVGGSNNVAVVTGAGSKWSVLNNLYVGVGGAGNSLIITNGGVVQADSAEIGSAATAVDNTVLITSAGSGWSNAGELLVGNAGADNRLTLTNSGEVYTDALTVGSDSTASGNSVAVESGSLLTVTNALVVGLSGSDNSVAVDDGTLLTGSTMIGDSTSASGNSLSVASTWTNASDVVVGDGGTNNTLRLDDSTAVIGGDVVVGKTATGDSNRVDVVAGSDLSIAGDLVVGDAGAMNEFLLDASTNTTANTYVGNQAGADYNRLDVIDSTWTNSGMLYVGNTGSVSTLTVLNSDVELGDLVAGGAPGSESNTVIISGGTLGISDLYVGEGASDQTFELSSNALSTVNTYVGEQSAASNNSMTVSNSSWTNQNDLYVGNAGSLNRLSVTNGTVVTDMMSIGSEGGANENSADFVEGSLVVVNHDLYVGNAGASNSLLISNSDLLSDTTYIGNADTADQNMMTVGSSWTNSGDVYVGYSGSSNSLAVTNGGSVQIGGDFDSVGLVVGMENDANYNTVLVTETSAVKVLPGALGGGVYVGYEGATNRFVLNDESTLETDMTQIGYQESADGNQLSVESADWMNSGTFMVGRAGSGNSLVVSNGTVTSGTAAGSSFVVGDVVGADNNSVVLEAGSELDVNTTMLVGNYGGSNMLSSSMSTVSVAQVTVGVDSNQNQIVLADDSLLSVSGDFDVGSAGSANSVVATNSAINSQNLTVGVALGSENNSVILTNTDLVVSENLVVGNEGSGNSLLADESSVSADRVEIGSLENATSNTVMLGSGSDLTSVFNLYVGNAGSDNNLSVSNGLVDVGADLIIGSTTEAKGNQADFTAGSDLFVDRDLFVGMAGASNALSMADGTLTVDGSTYVGYDSDANSAAVTNSSWTNLQDLTVGDSGSDNLVSVTNSAVTVGANLSLGSLNGADGNTMVVADSQVVVSNVLYVGDAGASNSLDLADSSLESSEAYIGDDAGADNNSMTLGSSWTNYGDVYVGNMGSSNRLSVDASTVLVGGTMVVGSESGADSNEVVLGSMSSLMVSNDLYVGNAGTANSLSATGSPIVVGGDLSVGTEAGAEFNAISLASGSALLVSNALYIGDAGNNNSLSATGSVIESTTTFIGDESSSNSVVMTDGSWDNWGDMTVGNLGSANSLTATGSAIVVGGDLSVGTEVTAEFNSVSLASGSDLLVSNSLYIGDAGNNNSLSATGSVIESTTTFIGDESSTNSVVMTDGGWDNWGDMTVGNLGSANSLSATGSAIMVGGDLSVGTEAGAEFNAISLASGSDLLVSNSLYIGDAGNNNSLSATGSVIESTTTFIGDESSTNSVVMTDGGWDNWGDMTVGNLGSANSLTATGSAIVVGGDLSVGTEAGAEFNAISLASGSDLLVSNALYIGDAGNNNSLSATGSVIESTTAFIGDESSSNSVVMTDGSWDNWGNMTVGNFGSANSLTATGSAIVVGGDLSVGTEAGAEFNAISLASGSDLLVSNALYIGDAGNNNSLSATGSVIESTTAFIGDESSTNSVVMTDGSWDNWGDMTVGNLGSVNSLTATGSAIMVGGDLSVGTEAGAEFNAISLASGSDLLVSNSLYIGDAGNNNSLSATGSVIESTTAFIGDESSSNSVVMTDGGWDNWGDMTVGNFGSANSLTATGSAIMVGGDLSVGTEAGAEFNAIRLASGSDLLVSNSLYIGDAGNNNSLSATGSVVESTTAFIGDESSTNRVVMTDGSWDNWGDMTVGNFGSANSLTATGSPIVVGGYLSVGTEAGAEFNDISLASGSDLLVSNALYVGAAGNNNSLSATGSVIESTTAFIGDESSTNSVVMTDGSWDNWGNMTVGNFGSANSLTATGSPIVVGGDLSVGTEANAEFNRISLASGSDLLVSNALYIGDAGNNNSLSATGSVIESTTTFIGDESSSNSVVMTDGSWDNWGDMTVGNFGSANSLVATGSPIVVGGDLSVGTEAGAEMNRMDLVSSSDLVVSNALSVGDAGASNSLMAMDSDIESGSAMIGNQSGADNNEVWFNSTWTNYNDLYVGNTGNVNRLIGDAGVNLGVASNLYIGYAGSTNSMTIGSNAVVSAETLTLGGLSNANANELTVGSDSLVAINGALTVGDAGSDNQMNVSDVTLLSGSTVVGSVATAMNNQLTVGTVWTNTGLVLVGSSGSGNSLSVVSNSSVVIGENLTVGEFTGADENEVVIDSGSDVYVAADLTVGDGGASNSFALVGSSLVTSNATIGADADYNQMTLSSSTWTNGLVLLVGSTGSVNQLTVDDSELASFALGIGGEVGSIDNRLSLVNGSALSAQIIEVGVYGDSNRLYVSDGSTVDASVLGVGYASSGNSLIVSNSSVAADSVVIGAISGANDNELLLWDGSDLVATNDLIIGAGGTSNRLALMEASQVDVLGELILTNSSALYISPTSRVDVADSYMQSADSLLSVAVNQTVNGTVAVTGDATLEDGAGIEISGVTSNWVVYSVLSATNLVVDFDQINWTTNGTDKALFLYSTETNGVESIEGRVALKAVGGVDGMMAEVADELDLIDQYLFWGFSEEAVHDSLEHLYGTASGFVPRAVMDDLNAYNFTLEQRIGYLRNTLGIASADRRAAEAPEGAAGPASTSDLGGENAGLWMKTFGTWSTKDATEDFNGYDASTYGFTVGADHAADDMLIGLSVGYSSGDVDVDNGDQSDLRTWYASLYSSMGTERTFFDVIIGLGQSDVEDSVADPYFDVSRDYTAGVSSIYVGTGRTYPFYDGSVIVTPEASFQYSYYWQNAYTERSDAIPRNVDDYSRNSYQSRVGVNVSTLTRVSETVVVRPEFRIHWVHEFNRDDQNLTYGLEGGVGTYQVAVQSPESDRLNMGAGVQYQVTEGTFLRLDYTMDLRENYISHTGEGSLRFKF